MDVVEFVEQVFGLHLMDYQKEFLIKVYEATRDEVYRTLCYSESIRTVQRSRSQDKNGRRSSWYRKIKRGERSC